MRATSAPTPSCATATRWRSSHRWRADELPRRRSDRRRRAGSAPPPPLRRRAHRLRGGRARSQRRQSRRVDLLRRLSPDGGEGDRRDRRRRPPRVARRRSRLHPPPRTPRRRRDIDRHRLRFAAPRRGLRGLPRDDRPDQADRADLEEGAHARRRGVGRMAAPVLTPIPAASAIVLRDAPLEVLMMRRPARSSFVPDAWVFPGGAVEEIDRARAEGDVLNAMRYAAARELFEEAGVSLGEPLDLEKLVWTSRWITPKGSPKRFEDRKSTRLNSSH